jgi:hypothetical protein
MHLSNKIWSLIVACTLLAGCKHGNADKSRQDIADSTHLSQKTTRDSIEYHKICELTDLSRAYDFKVDFTRKHRGDDTSAAWLIRIIVMDKKSGQVADSIVTTAYYLPDQWEDCEHVRSYTTGKNAKAQAQDNNYGQLVVADFNFDSREDFAIIHDFGGNGGPFYQFYLQDERHKFVYNAYLTDSVVYFPDQDAKTKRLVTYVHAGACCMGRHTYKMLPGGIEWKEISHEILDATK